MELLHDCKVEGDEVDVEIEQELGEVLFTHLRSKGLMVFLKTTSYESV